ncbi:ester cyclase [Planctomonas psychrotolerans]|uniref:ester cyclase n=1 Tax=Planctomonas psychrotolerans TaxID=2528712 RepID=UPI001239873F|nr:ester cyclase [Planctomonas psychrotolerans]
MSRDETTQLMNAYFEALLNGGDFAQYYAPDILWTTMETGDTMRGRDAVRSFIVALHTRMFDAHPEMRHLAVGDGVAAVEMVFVGTHIGDFGGVPASGSRVRLPYTVFYDVTEAGITELRAYVSIRALIDQISGPRSEPGPASTSVN